MPYLIFADDQQEFDRRELFANSAAFVVGRAAECDVPVRDVLLSRQHCRFEPLADRWIVSDLRSKNGTRVDGRPIERHVLRDGEVVRAGRTRICFCAGALVPPPAATRRPREVRPINPVEALAGTVMGFHLGDMQEDSERSGFPIPRPRPPQPVGYARENVGAMVSQLSATALQTAPAQRAAPRRLASFSKVIERDRSMIMLMRPLAPQVALPAILHSASVAIQHTTVTRWHVIIYIGMAIAVFAGAMSILAMGWLR